MKLTVPEVGACTGALTKALASAINWPLSTCSPGVTQGSAGAPRCWASGRISRAGRGAWRTGVRLESSLRSGGWMPPWMSQIFSEVMPLAPDR